MAFHIGTPMRTKRSIKWGLVIAAAACVAVAASAGCELLVDFDRSKIPQEGGLIDVTTNPDAPATNETGTGSETGDDGSSANETSTDGGGDGTTTDAEGGTTEAATEAAAETGSEPGPEPTPEAGPDATDGGDAGD
jgi:hypothetical protein